MKVFELHASFHLHFKYIFLTHINFPCISQIKKNIKVVMIYFSFFLVLYTKYIIRISEKTYTDKDIGTEFISRHTGKTEKKNCFYFSCNTISKNPLVYSFDFIQNG